jgi:hypothetical protein
VRGHKAKKAFGLLGPGNRIDASFQFNPERKIVSFLDQTPPLSLINNAFLSFRPHDK